MIHMLYVHWRFSEELYPQKEVISINYMADFKQIPMLLIMKNSISFKVQEIMHI